MMSSEIKGVGIVLKKIILPSICAKVRSIIPECIRDGVWLCFSGIDAINFHFTNACIHTDLIEMTMTSDKNYEGVPNFNTTSLNVLEEFTKIINTLLLDLSNNQSMVLTKDALEKCNMSTYDNGIFVVANSEDTQRLTIDLMYNISERFPIMEIRLMENVNLTPFDRFGLRYLSLGFVYMDINTAQERFGGNDWQQRQNLLKSVLHRPDITLSFWTISEIAKECFPGIATKRIGSSKAAIAKFNDNISHAPEIYSTQVNDLRTEINTEVNDNMIECFNLQSLIHRATHLGYFPDHTKFHSSLDNYYNNSIIRELRTELTC